MNVAVTFDVLVVLTPAIEHDHVVCKLKHTTTLPHNTQHILDATQPPPKVTYCASILICSCWRFGYLRCLCEMLLR